VCFDFTQFSINNKENYAISDTFKRPNCAFFHPLQVVYYKELRIKVYAVIKISKDVAFLSFSLFVSFLVLLQRNKKIHRCFRFLFLISRASPLLLKQNKKLDNLYYLAYPALEHSKCFINLSNLIMI